jgi:hypothetical protein
MYTIVYQVFDIGITTQEPQQLIDDTLEEELLGGNQRKALAEVETHLVTKDSLGTCSRSVATNNALATDSI